MANFLSLPACVIEELSINEMLSLTGGAGNDCTNNGSGLCDGTNNGTGSCKGNNNHSGLCNGTNNSSGRCTDPDLYPPTPPVIIAP